MTSIKQQNKKSGLQRLQTESRLRSRSRTQCLSFTFSITLTQKRVRPPLWIILVLHAELAREGPSVKGLDHSNPPSTLELVCDAPSLLHARTQTNFRKCRYKFSRTHIDVARAHTHTHTHKHKHPSLLFGRHARCKSRQHDVRLGLRRRVSQGYVGIRKPLKARTRCALSEGGGHHRGTPPRSWHLSSRPLEFRRRVPYFITK